ncbi:NAD-dependent epimerase/dehydratase family protein [candidate division KSB1 bacterium]|nr:NAD-dependent epimerase/dehydratase family protein [candidate division KSB1 bacterium]
MRILVIGGTKFIGPFVVRQLIERGHEVTVFHRGQTKADLPNTVRYIQGDRKQLHNFRAEFEYYRPQVVLDMAPYTEQEAQAVAQTFKGLAQRVVAISSQDVYRAYERVRRTHPGPPDAVPLTEESPLRENLYPYRQRFPSQQLGKDFDELWHDYDKILVERVFISEPELPATVLRLPWVYGPGDYLHRMFPHLKRMGDGRNFILLEEGQAGWRWTRGYVENVAAAIVLAITSERARNRIYNVGEEKALTEAEWVDHIGRAAKWNGKVVAVKKEKLPAHLSMNLDWNQHLVVDTSRIRREFGYVEPVPLAEAIAHTVRWEQENPPEQIDPKQFDYKAEDAVLKAVDIKL